LAQHKRNEQPNQVFISPGRGWADENRALFSKVSLLDLAEYVALSAWEPRNQEASMEALQQETPRATYKSPKHAQVWFLSRGRRAWKERCMEQKVELKRLRNRVADVCKSREKWRREAEEAQRRARELEAEIERLREAAPKKTSR
jgi:hypothetical protein